MSDTYNGWTNYETWAVNLWLTNDEFTNNRLAELAQDAWTSATPDDVFTREQAARYSLADSLQAWVEEEMLPDLEASLASDLLRASVARVDWSELAENALEGMEN